MTASPRRTSLLRWIALIAWSLAAVPAAWAAPDKPSRAAFKGCAWEKFASPAVGLDAWVQRCDYGFRQIDFIAVGKSLAVRFSDGGAPDAVVDVLELRIGEAPEDGLRRIFTEKSDPEFVEKCVLAPYRGGKTPAGVRRYTFVPNTTYARALKAKADPNEVPDPPCGEWGAAPDGIQYFEVPATGASLRKVLFVRIGQDEPLYDEQTLHLVAPSGGPR